jgi:hypothetical protein
MVQRSATPRKVGSPELEKLRQLWGRFVTMGATDNDLHQIVTVSQDMECNRIVTILDEMLASPRLRGSHAGVIRVLRDHLAKKEHRANG